MVSKHNKHAKRPKRSREGFWGRFIYFWGKAFVNIRQNLLLHSLATGTITLALLIISLFLLVYVNLEGSAEQWSRKVEVVVYYDRDLSSLEISDLKNRMQALPGTSRVAYVSKDEALRRFRDRLKGQEALLDGVAANTLPASFELSLKSSYRTTEAIEAYVSALKKLPGIGEVQYGEEWVRKFTTFMQFMRFLSMIIGAFLVLAVIFIVANTIKLTVMARKDELEILSLVGASRMFIKAPFLLEGLVQGAVGALLALAILSIAYVTFLYNAGNFLAINPTEAGLSFLSWEYLVGILLAGTFLGFAGSLVSLKRFIQ